MGMCVRACACVSVYVCVSLPLSPCNPVQHYLRVYEAQSGRLNATHTHAIGDLSQFSADEIKLNRDRLLATLEDLERAEHMKKNSKRTDIEIPDEDTWTPDTYIESPMYTSTPMAGLPDELSYLSSSEDDDDHRTDIIYSYPGVGDAANVQHARRTLNEHERIYMALLQKDGSTLVQDTFLPADMSKAADIGSITGDVVAIKTAPPPAVDRNQKSAETSDDSYSQGRHPAWPESSDSVDEDAYLEQVLDFLEQVEHMVRVRRSDVSMPSCARVCVCVWCMCVCVCVRVCVYVCVCAIVCVPFEPPPPIPGRPT